MRSPPVETLVVRVCHEDIDSFGRVPRILPASPGARTDRLADKLGLPTGKLQEAPASYSQCDACRSNIARQRTWTICFVETQEQFVVATVLVASIRDRRPRRIPDSLRTRFEMSR